MSYAKSGITDHEYNRRDLSSRSQALPGNARVERLCRGKSSRRQAEPARQGVPGQSPGTRGAVQEQKRFWRREQK